MNPPLIFQGVLCRFRGVLLSHKSRISWQELHVVINLSFSRSFIPRRRLAIFVGFFCWQLASIKLILIGYARAIVARNIGTRGFPMKENKSKYTPWNWKLPPENWWLENDSLSFRTVSFREGSRTTNALRSKNCDNSFVVATKTDKQSKPWQSFGSMEPLSLSLSVSVCSGIHYCLSVSDTNLQWVRWVESLCILAKGVTGTKNIDLQVQVAAICTSLFFVPCYHVVVSPDAEKRNKKSSLFN